MKDFWNKRYEENSFAYGTLPNTFFKQQLDKLTPGQILLPAEGEGRNAIYAVRQGWQVIAFDFSATGMKKAISLAEQHEVHIDYEVVDVLDFSSDKKFDVIGLCYAHFPADIRAKAHRHLLKFLKPKGTVILEAFSKNQLGKPSGGPKHKDMLFSIKELQNEFSTLTFDFLEEKTIILKEGEYHQGEASVIQFVGQLS